MSAQFRDSDLEDLDLDAEGDEHEEVGSCDDSGRSGIGRGSSFSLGKAVRAAPFNAVPALSPLMGEQLHLMPMTAVLHVLHGPSTR